jgi:FtsP/CotA-like multicopper oxidase with cupredoxin domain
VYIFLGTTNDCVYLLLGTINDCVYLLLLDHNDYQPMHLHSNRFWVLGAGEGGIEECWAAPVSTTHTQGITRHTISTDNSMS